MAKKVFQNSALNPQLNQRALPIEVSLSCFSRYHFPANNIDPTPGIENGEDTSPSCAEHIRSDERRRRDGAIGGLVQD